MVTVQWRIGEQDVLVDVEVVWCDPHAKTEEGYLGCTGHATGIRVVALHYLREVQTQAPEWHGPQPKQAVAERRSLPLELLSKLDLKLIEAEAIERASLARDGGPV